MDVSINPLKGMWTISVTIKKSGNRYTYSTLLNEEPSEFHVKYLWKTQRKHWSRCL